MHGTSSSSPDVIVVGRARAPTDRPTVVDAHASTDVSSSRHDATLEECAKKRSVRRSPRASRARAASRARECVDVL
jgi:hypothetical protein